MQCTLVRSVLLAGTLLGLAAPAWGAETFFDAKIRPVLADTCLRCHGPKKSRGGLRLDSRQALVKGGEHGPAIVPGAPERSLLIQAIRHAHAEIRMPPGKPLPAGVVANFVTWIKDGAAWPKGATLRPSASSETWALEAVARVEPPPDPDGWARGPIDRFIRARLRRQGLRPAAAAERRTLIRRITFDLTGLPPAPEEIDAFLADRAADAYERLADRLLASPAYGERWGRHWLDVVRYADTSGFEADHRYPSAWRYRDYVVRSLNADKPFDRFLHEQVAGDELWPGSPEARVATGLYCVGPTLEEAAMVPGQLESEWMSDAADTTGAAFLGLTFGCARCHDHKYDPLSQKDHYGLQAFFAASDRAFPDKVRLLRIKGLNGLLSDAPVPKKLLDDPRCTVRTEAQAGFGLFHRDRPLEVRRLHRGELSKPREVVGPALPAALVGSGRKAPLIVPAGQWRAALARWLTAGDNPLTARVLVNRVWAWHFGQGLVRTPNDLGSQGERPSHPELLDWLARDFREHGWRLKRLHRQIVLSSTYRMGSVAGGPGLRLDPPNRLLWHFPRRRLEGEAIRDSLLACAGTLNRSPFGPPVVPPLGKQELAGLFGAGGKWPVTKDAREHTRRSVYLLVRRTFIYPLFGAFDAPELMTSCPRRLSTVVPAQALALLNSPLAREQALAFARRLRRECGTDAERIGRAWRLAFGRPASPGEAAQALEFLRRRQGGEALADLCLALFNANEFVHVD